MKKAVSKVFAFSDYYDPGRTLWVDKPFLSPYKTLSLGSFYNMAFFPSFSDASGKTLQAYYKIREFATSFLDSDTVIFSVWEVDRSSARFEFFCGEKISFAGERKIETLYWFEDWFKAFRSQTQVSPYNLMMSWKESFRKAVDSGLLKGVEV